MEHQYIDITQDKAALQEMVTMTGSLSVPVIAIDGEFSIGYDKKWMLEKLGLTE